jgi:hypothetical protein
VVATAPGPAFEPASNRCDWCSGALTLTRLRRRPIRQDHLPGCREYELAARVIEYAVGLKAAVSATSVRTGDYREWRRYSARAIKDLIRAACRPSVREQLSELSFQYGHDAARESDGAPTGANQAASMLSLACQALLTGKDPVPAQALKAPEGGTTRHV